MYFLFGMICNEYLTQSTLWKQKFLWFKLYIETFSLFTLYEENPSFTGEFPSQGANNAWISIFVEVNLNKLLNKQSIWLLETPWWHAVQTNTTDECFTRSQSVKEYIKPTAPCKRHVKFATPTHITTQWRKYVPVAWVSFNTLRARRKDRYFADDIFKCIF